MRAFAVWVAKTSTCKGNLIINLFVVPHVREVAIPLSNCFWKRIGLPTCRLFDPACNARSREFSSIKRTDLAILQVASTIRFAPCKTCARTFVGTQGIALFSLGFVYLLVISYVREVTILGPTGSKRLLPVNISDSAYNSRSRSKFCCISISEPALFQVACALAPREIGAWRIPPTNRIALFSFGVVHLLVIALIWEITIHCPNRTFSKAPVYTIECHTLELTVGNAPCCASLRSQIQLDLFGRPPEHMAIGAIVLRRFIDCSRLDRDAGRRRAWVAKVLWNVSVVKDSCVEYHTYLKRSITVKWISTMTNCSNVKSIAIIGPSTTRFRHTGFHGRAAVKYSSTTHCQKCNAHKLHVYGLCRCWDNCQVASGSTGCSNFMS